MSYTQDSTMLDHLLSFYGRILHSRACTVVIDSEKYTKEKHKTSRFSKIKFRVYLCTTFFDV
jgi:hypothetical protein